MDQPAAPTTTAEGNTEYTAPPDAPAKGECQSIEVEKAANGGYTARCRYKQPPSRGDTPSPYVEPETYAFSTFPDLVAQLATEFGESAPGASTPPPPAAPPMGGPSDDIDTERA